MIKRLVIFTLVLKILVLASAQTGILASDHTIINEKNLPTLLKNDTVIITGEVWIESVDSEVRQRGEILHYKRKLHRLHHIMERKKGFESEIDSLVLITDSLLFVADSLNAELLLALENESGEIVEKLVTVTARLESTREQYFIVRNQLKRSRSKKMILITILIAESVVLALLI